MGWSDDIRCSIPIFSVTCPVSGWEGAEDWHLRAAAALQDLRSGENGQWFFTPPPGAGWPGLFKQQQQQKSDVTKQQE